MADTETAIADAPAETSIPGFGNIEEAFNQAFPSTAENDEAPVTPPALTLEEEKPIVEPPAPKPEPKKPAEGDVPESIFGDVPEAPKAEPPVLKNTAEIRAAYKTSQAEIARLTTELEELRTKATTPPSPDEGAAARLAELQAQNQQLSAAVEKTNLMAHPKFQENFVQPRRNLMAKTDNLLSEVGANPAALEKAMSLTGKQRIAALDDFLGEIESPTVRNKVALAIDQMDEIDTRAQAVLADWKTSWEQITQHEKAEAHRIAQEQEQQLNHIFDGAIEHLRDKWQPDKEHPNLRGLEVLKKVEGVEWWNKQGEQIIEAARELMFKTSNPGDMSAAAILAASSGVHRGLWLKTRAKVQELEKQIAELKGAEPDLGGSRPEGGEAEDDSKLSFAERVARGSGLQ